VGRCGCDLQRVAADGQTMALLALDVAVIAADAGAIVRL
jgi:hypothetical protein